MKTVTDIKNKNAKIKMSVSELSCECWLIHVQFVTVSCCDAMKVCVGEK